MKKEDIFKKELISFIRNSDQTFIDINLEKMHVSQLVIIKTHIELRNNSSQTTDSSTASSAPHP
jgi:hypothetical protein